MTISLVESPGACVSLAQALGIGSLGRAWMLISPSLACSLVGPQASSCLLADNSKSGRGHVPNKSHAG